MQKKGQGRPAAYPSTVGPAESAGHLSGLIGGARDLAIDEYREVQVLRNAIRQRVEEGGAGALTAVAKTSGVTVAWLTRLLRWKEHSLTASERPPHSVSFAKMRRVAGAVGIDPRAVVQRVLPPETFDEFLERTESAINDPQERILVDLLQQLDAEQRRKTIWQLRGIVQRMPARTDATCAFCGGRIPVADVERLAGICLECVGSSTGVMPLSYFAAGSGAQVDRTGPDDARHAALEEVNSDGK